MSIALGVGLTLLGLFTAMIVCSRMNDPASPRGGLDTQPLPRRADHQEDSLEVFEI